MNIFILKLNEVSFGIVESLCHKKKKNKINTLFNDELFHQKKLVIENIVICSCFSYQGISEFIFAIVFLVLHLSLSRLSKNLLTSNLLFVIIS